MLDKFWNTFNAAKFAFDYIRKHGADAFRKLLEENPTIREQYGIQGIYDWIVLPDWVSPLKKEHVLEGFKRGLIEPVSIVRQASAIQPITTENNMIMNLFRSAIIANMVGSPSAAQDLQIDYFALGLGDVNAVTGTQPTASDTTLNEETYRVAPDESYETSGSFMALKYLDADTGNLSTGTITAVGSATEITLDTGEAADIDTNHRLRVFTNKWEIVTVASVAGDVVTLKASTPLSITSGIVGNTVQRMYANVGLICGDASATLESGTLVNKAKLELPKPADPPVSGLLRVQVKFLI